MAECYRFTTVGTSEIYRHSDSRRSVVIGAETFTRAPGGISRERSDQTFDGETLTIDLPGDLQPLPQFLSPLPNGPIQVDVLESDGTQIFTGRLISPRFTKKNRCKIEVRSNSGAFDGEIPRRRCTTTCPWATYDAQCGVDPAGVSPMVNVAFPAGIPFQGTFAVNDTTLSIGNTRLVNADFADYPDKWFSGGQFRYSNGATERRAWVLSHATDTINLMIPTGTLTAATNFTIRAGDDKTLATCRDKFNNLVPTAGQLIIYPYVMGFGGVPFAPGRNPATQGFL